MEKENYIKTGILTSCIICLIGLIFNSYIIELAGFILFIVVQLIDLSLHLLQDKITGSENIKQVLCKCENIEIVNEWEGIDLQLGKCIKCGKYFAINEKINKILPITEEEYTKYRNTYNVLSLSLKDLEVELKEMEKSLDKMRISKTNEEDDYE